MKERPILFNDAMVRAILDGRKTQTRRVIKPQPVAPYDDAYFDKYNKGPQWNWWTKDNKQCLGQIIRCPYGKPGDHLWVREAWSPDATQMYPYPKCWYRATDGDFIDTGAMIHDSDCEKDGENSDCLACWEWEHGKFKWRPSIHMPRWASRIILEITDVRVERLNEISAKDVLSEGIPDAKEDFKIGGPDIYSRHCFKKVWTSQYGALAWESNPWVWVIEFKRAATDGSSHARAKPSKDSGIGGS